MDAATNRTGYPALAAALLLALLAVGCGGPSSPDHDDPLGTVSLRNETDQGMAPTTVVAFFLQPVGESDPGPNRLLSDLPPGGVVIIGLFPPGLYNGVALLGSGGSVPMLEIEVRAAEPTDFVVPPL